jgi:hypothetical protein
LKSAIITRVDPRLDLTVHTFEGAITSQDIIGTIEEYYRGRPTSNVVWDYAEAEFDQCGEENLKSIVMAASKHAWSTSNAKSFKSALILPGDPQFAIGRMFETFAELENTSTQIQSFRSMTEAKQWLGVKAK